jgi:hypothetical protein
MNLREQIFRKYGNQILRKSVQWEPTCSIRTDRRDEANSAFRNFTNETKNWNTSKNLMRETINTKQDIKAAYSGVQSALKDNVQKLYSLIIRLSYVDLTGPTNLWERNKNVLFEFNVK